MTSFEEQAALVYDDGFCPDGGYIDRAIVDQWWAITVACDHGQWRGVSNGPIDLGQGLARAIANARRAHEGLGPCPVLSPERRACEFTEGHGGKHHAYAPTGGAPIESWAEAEGAGPVSFPDMLGRWLATPYPKCSRLEDHGAHEFISSAGYRLECLGQPAESADPCGGSVRGGPGCTCDPPF